ncbi:MAG: hypothetical protein RMK94_16835, partial [Armatimonadota bacterium]|nr:hypothetical protein [Armatimonadota bacterium]
RLVVTVVDENDPSVPLADAEIEITLDDGRKILGKTDASGKFIVDLPLNKQFSIKVRPPNEFEAFFQEAFETFVTDENEIQLLIPIRRSGVVIPVLTELKIQPERVTLRVRERVQFQLQLDPSPDRPIRPIWSVHGGIGVITPDGLFVATRAGQGTVKVKVGELQAEARVIVQSD